MLRISFGFLLGIGALVVTPSLHDVTFIIAGQLIVFCVFLYASKFIQNQFIARLKLSLLAVIVGYAWALICASHLLKQSLPSKFEDQSIQVEGVVLDLPEVKTDYTQFIFKVSKIIAPSNTLQTTFNARLRWYHTNVILHPGQTWRLQVKLKQPHGLLNAGGFDYEAWLFSNGIRATGYVKDTLDNQILANANYRFWVATIRSLLRDKLTEAFSSHRSYSLALALGLGDRSFISEKQWRVLRETGTAHLLAISGLHLSLLGGFLFWCLRFVLALLIQDRYRINPIKIAAFATLLGIWFYAFLVGMTIPTQRAVIVMSLVMIHLMLSKKIELTQLLGIGLIIILIAHPFSVLSASFWLSFGAVALILLLIKLFPIMKSKITHWMMLQVGLCVLLIPVSLFYFSQASIVAPIANFIAVPVVSFIVLPMLILALVWFGFGMGTSLFESVLSLLDYLWFYLNFLSELEWASIPHVTISLLQLIVLIIALFCLLLAPRLGLRPLALLLFTSVLLVKQAPIATDSLHLTLLDVGQGLSVVVRTSQGALLYDAGAAYKNGLNMGESVIAPYLLQQGINKLKMMIISHGDNDHIGGAEYLLDNLEVNELISGSPGKFSRHSVTACRTGQTWLWDKVKFRILHPRSQVSSSNNNSCVLMIEYRGYRVLLTGDIEHEIEEQLIEQYGKSLQSDVLIVPHHGSLTSSTLPFVKTVDPKLALIGVGYQNRFKLPRTEVVARYQKQGARVLTSADSGQIDVIISPHSNEPIQVKRYRVHNNRIWYHQH